MQPHANQETAFEKPRGISGVERKEGFAQVHVSQLSEPMMDQRLRVLEAVAAAGVSIDFVKLTPSGMAFVIPEESAEQVERALTDLSVKFSIRRGRTVVLVHAVNMRDEEGLIARILERAIGSGARIDHVGDMHDRVLMVLESADAGRVVEALSQP
jgi:aspartate kinase